MGASRGRRTQRRALARTRARGVTGGHVLLRMRPTLFLAVRESAHTHGLSMPVFILAFLHETFLNENIFELDNDAIRRKVRG